MQERTFTSEVRSGHKENAVEVPFNPATVWGCKPRPFAPGRNGIGVRVRIGGVTFDSHVVSRSGKRWLLLPPEAERAAGIAVGSEAVVSIGVPDAAA